MADQITKLELVTAESLQVAKRQSLSLKITTRGNDGVVLTFPLGESAADLMSPSEFENCSIDYSQQPPPEALEIERLDKDASISIGITDPDATIKLDISLESFLVEQHPGSVDIVLRANTLDAPPADTLQVVKQGAPTRIESFTADAYNVIAGRKVTLSWTLSQEADYELLAATKPEKPVQKGRGKTGSLAGQVADDFTLKVLPGGQPADTRHLRIHGFKATGFESYELNLPTEPAVSDVLGLYAHPVRGRLYALLRVGERSAQLWSTSHGFDPELWEPVIDGSKNTVTLSLEAARRPGIIFQDRLWLIGGDCCDPDEPGTAVGYYDFQETAWHDVRESDARHWPKEMSERMGHAVVALPGKGKVWMMGGWSQNGGISQDIWEFDGKRWVKLAAPCKVCLFGAAATSSAVWRVGGFTDPGGKASVTAALYDSDIKASDVNVSIAPGWQYCASALFVLDSRSDMPSGVGSTYESASAAYKHVLFSFGIERGKTIQVSEVAGTSAHGVFLDRDYYHIQAAVFQGAAFLRMLRPDRQAAGSRLVSYLVKVDR